jgi:hypothetical protein
VINGTEGGGATEDLQVVLIAFQGQEQTERQVAVVDAQGQYRFEGLDVDGGWAYLVRVSYGEVVYSSGVLAFQEGQTELQSDVTVYETMTDDTAVRVARAHILISLLDGGLSVTELYVFENPTDRTYVGKDEIDGRRWTSRFLLPKAAHDLALDDGTLGGRFLLAQDGFVDTEPQWPGGTTVVYSYELDCSGGACDLQREVVHPIVNMNVLIPDIDARIESKRLTFQGQREAQGGSYLNYTARDLTPGERLDLSLRLPGAVAPVATTSGGTTQALPWIILGAVLAALVLVYPFWRRRVEDAARKGG